MRRYWALLACAGTLLAVAPLQAQQGGAFPSKPVRVIVSVPAGGGVDTVTRVITEQLSKRWGQTVVVENRGGAGGNIGGEAVFGSEPDGYTLLASQPAPITINKVLYTKMPYDPEKFETVAIMSELPNVLLVRPDFPAKTAKEFVAYAKANPGKLNYASQGIGTTSHLTAELFSRRTGLKFTHVPYKGTAPALNDLIASHVDFIFMELAMAKRLHDGNKARILAAATPKRISALSDIPTLEETGVSGVLSSTWNGISAPPKTPKTIVDKINADVTAVQKSAAVVEHFKKLNVEVTPRTPVEAKVFVADELKRWSEVVREAGVKPH
ncbi:MAG: tripartite tricarboxylate transporter substrate binding protein [Rhizobiales bacterium]|nr:tripartite tricarboxylate transporter substrate binding protein [Hyphomicrobiales bacterium]